METAPAARPPVFAEPTPMGLICLAIGCAALVPIALGWALTPEALKTAAIFCLLFGAGGQFLAGLMSFVNGNVLGGTLFTAFAFNWAFNYWVLDAIGGGFKPDHAVLLAVDVTMLLVFLVFTYGFGFYSGLLFFFLVDIDVLQLSKILRDTLHVPMFAKLVAVSTALLGLLALYIAFAMIMNPIVGRKLFPAPGPLFTSKPPA